MAKTIGDEIKMRAILDRHDEFLAFAERRLSEYRDHAPRIDTGEGLIYVADHINDCRWLYSPDGGPLLPITIEHVNGEWTAVLDLSQEPTTATMRNTGD